MKNRMKQPHLIVKFVINDTEISHHVRKGIPHLPLRLLTTNHDKILHIPWFCVIPIFSKHIPIKEVLLYFQGNKTLF